MAVVAAASRPKVHRASSAIRIQRLLRLVPLISLAVFIGVIFTHQERPSLRLLVGTSSARRRRNRQQGYNSDNTTTISHLYTVALDDTIRQDVPALTCPYMSFDDLSHADRLHLAKDTGKLSLVCCTTTAGPWNIVVHHSWAPHGAQRFLDMVESGYFSIKVPLMRCVEDWMCQFGLAGERSEDWTVKIPDDPQWLTTSSSSGESNKKKHVHFKTGFFGYAGYGPKTRGRQFFVALSSDNQLGQELWEVPWAELIGAHSFETLRNIYKGYGEEGPDQYKMIEQGAHEYAMREFPNLDYITGCSVVGVE